MVWCGYFWGNWVTFITTDEFSVRVTKITSRIGVSWTHSLSFYFLTNLNLMNYVTYLNLIMAILSLACKPDNFEFHNTLKPSFTNIQRLCLNFIGCESFFESNSPYILALCETNWDDSIDFGNFSVRVCLPLIQKDSSTHMHVLAVYVKEGLPFAQDVSLENSADSSYLYFWLALLYSMSYFIFLYQSPSSFSSTNHLLHLCSWFLILFHLT